MKDLKTLLINNIQLTYKSDHPSGLTPAEIKTYIESASFYEDVLKFSKTSIFIIDYGTSSYLYCSSNLKEITGYSAEDALRLGPKFTLSHVDTDDLIHQQQAHKMSYDIFLSLTEEERSTHKFAFTFRHRNEDGREVMILQTSIFLKWDERGRPLIKLILASDISSYKHNSDVVFFVSKLNQAGKSEIIFQKNFSSNDGRLLSSREIDIVNLIASGESTEKIGQRLGISENTIKNHRKKIMKKLGCKNSAQLAGLANLYGFSSAGHPGVQSHRIPVSP